MESNSDSKALKKYSLKSVSLLFFLFILFATEKVLGMVPFIKELYFFKTMELSQFISALLCLVAVAAMIEYAIDSSKEVELMLPWLPEFGKPYRSALYFLLSVFSYYAFLPLVSVFSNEYILLSYKLLFTGLVLWFACIAGFYFYVHRNEIGTKIIETIGAIKI